MAGMDKNKKLLLGYLEGGTISLLVAVVLFRPFRDDENMNGYSGADRAEVIALLCYLGELAVASKCMRTMEDRESGKLRPFEDAAATLAGLFFVGFPGKPAVTLYGLLVRCILHTTRPDAHYVPFWLVQPQLPIIVVGRGQIL